MISRIWPLFIFWVPACGRGDPPAQASPTSQAAPTAPPTAPPATGCAGLRACGQSLGASAVPMGAKLGGVMVGEADQGPEKHCNEILLMRVGGLQDDLYHLPPACALDLDRLAAEHGLPPHVPGPAITPCGRLRQCGRALTTSTLPPALATMGPDLVRLAESARDPFDLMCQRSLQAVEKSVTEVKGVLPEACR